MITLKESQEYGLPGWFAMRQRLRWASTLHRRNVDKLSTHERKARELGLPFPHTKTLGHEKEALTRTKEGLDRAERAIKLIQTDQQWSQVET